MKRLKEQSFLLKIANGLLTAILVIGMLGFSVKAEEKSTLEQLEELIGEEFTVDNIQKTGVLDENFAQAIYDSIIKDSNNFTIVDKSKERKASAQEIIDQGQYENIEGIEYILNYYAGLIDAENKDILRIDGIRLLRQAGRIDLRNNKFRSLMPLDVGENNLYDDKIWNHFGSRARNTEIDISENNIFEYPSQFGGGRIVLLNVDYYPLNEIPLAEMKISTLLEDDASEGISIPHFTVPPILCDNQIIKLTGRGLYLISDWDNLELKIENNYANDCPGPISISGVKETGLMTLIVPSLQRITYLTVSPNDNPTEQTSSFKWKKDIYVQLYTKVETKSECQGKVNIVKTDSINGKGLMGAEFTLYNEIGQEIKIVETDIDGKATFDQLKPGNYIVKETRAPEGYTISSEEKRFTVDGGSTIGVKSTSPNPIIINDGTGEKELDKLENGAYIASGNSKENIELEMKEGGNSKLKEIEVSWTKGTNGIAGHETFKDVDSALDKIKETTIKNYQNTTVKAIFENRTENNEEVTLNFENEPIESSKPEEPGKPTDPTEPSNPEEPEKPTNPTDPSNSIVPIKPNETGESANPNKGTLFKPEKPSTSVEKSEGSKRVSTKDISTINNLFIMMTLSGIALIVLRKKKNV